MREEAGPENFFPARAHRGRGPRTAGQGVPPARLRRPQSRTGVGDLGDRRRYFARRHLGVRPAGINLVDHDPFLVLADYADYIRCQGRSTGPGGTRAHGRGCPFSTVRAAVSSPPTGRSPSTATTSGTSSLRHDQGCSEAMTHNAETGWRTGSNGELTDDAIRRIDAWFRAANYLSVGQIYLLNNPLLRTPLSRDDVKPRLLGHWGTTPGLNFLCPSQPGHWDRSQSTIHHHRSRPRWPPAQWPMPTSTAPTPSTTPTSPKTPRGCAGCSGSSRSPAASRRTSLRKPRAPSTRAANWAMRCRIAYGAAFDNPDLLVAAVVGDGEAETGALATSWHSNKFMHPAGTAWCC